MYGRFKKVMQYTSDEELMGRFCSTCDEELFRELMSRYYAKAIAYIQRKVINRHFAEDIVQETFLKVVRNKDHYDPSQKFSPWFFSILNNTCIDAVRQRQRHQTKLDKIAANIELFRYEDDDMHEEVRGLLNGVNEADRSLLVDHFVYGMTFGEISEKLGRSKESLKKRAQRAIKKIRESLV